MKVEYTYNDLNAFGSSPVFSYSYHKQMTDGGYGVNVFTGSPSTPGITNQGSCVLYGDVIEDRLNMSNASRSRSKYYFKFPTEAVPVMSGVPFPKMGNLNSKFISGMPYKTELFEYNEINHVFDLKRVEESELQPVNSLTDYIQNVQSAWTHPNIPYGDYLVWPGNDPFSANTYPAMNVSVGDYTYKLYRDTYLPMEKTSRSFATTGEFVETENFQYDTQNGNIKVVQKENSNGDLIETRIKYKNDYLIFSNSQDQWNLMLSDLLAGLPVEVSVFVKKKNEPDFKLANSTLYKYEHNNVKAVYKVNLSGISANFVESNNTQSGFVSDARYSLEYEVLSFDSKYNPITVKDKSRTVSYIYDDQQEDVIAKVDNSSAANIAYTSFEYSDFGGWIVQGSGLTSSQAFSGSSSFQLSAVNSILKQSLLSGNYVVSYWSRNGSVLVNGSAGNSSIVNGGWTLFEHILTNVTSVQISGSANIDELRLCPKDAQMTTFTYKELVGIVSQNDFNNIINYFEYDGFGRLKLIRDGYGRIIKLFCYNYAGQLADCSIPVLYYNTPQSQTFTKNNCGTCSQGSQVLYTVAGNTYSSPVSVEEANQLALNDIASNGQNYANTNGTCTSLNTVYYTNNTTQANYTATYTSRTTGQVFAFPVPANGSGVLGCLPTDSYNVTIAAPGGVLPQLLFTHSCRFSISGLSATFYKVSIPACSSLTMDYDLY